MKGILDRTLGLVGLIWLSVAMAGNAATIRTWTGAGADDLASTPQNWSGETAPVTGDHIRFDDSHLGNAWTDATWDLEIEPASWTQTVDYAGTVTIQTKYPGQGSFTNLTITGDVTLEGGTWTHPANSGGHTPVDRLAVTVGGDFVLGANATINAHGKGHAGQTGPAHGPNWNHYTAGGASHGGLASPVHTTTIIIYKTYGSIREPIGLGSGAAGRGGGAVSIRVAGSTALDGTILVTGTDSAQFAGGSGGSVWMTTGALSGDGLIDASAGTPSGTGSGGGRIAIVLTNGTSFASVVTRAYGSGISSRRGAAGTIYLETKDQAPNAGTLKIDNNDVSGFAHTLVKMNNANLSRWAQTLMTPEENDLSAFSEIVISGKGVLGLNTNTVWDLGNAVNLTTFGVDQSFVAAPYTNHLALPADWTFADYELLLYDGAAFNSLTVTNGVLRLMDADAEPGLAVSGDLHIAAAGIVSGHRVSVGNDLTIDDEGVLTHQPFDEAYRLILEVGNDLMVHDGGRIHADGIGFPRGSGPGRGSATVANGQPAASHGGQGTPNPGVTGQPVTYGSILRPVRFGSSAYAIGGGAIQVTVTGTTVLNGEITARPVGGLADGAGGSIWLTTGTLEGNGIIDVTTRYSISDTLQRPSGGGRIAVYVSESGLDEIDLRARGGRDGTRRAAAGTIYTETAGMLPGWGTIRIDNNQTAQSETNIATQLPPATEWPDEDLSWTKLEIDRLARVSLTSDLTLRDLYILDEGARLHLNGHTLRLRSPYHADWGSEENVIYDGGEIIWTKRGTIFTFR